MDSDNDSYQDEEYTYEDYAEYGDEEEDEVVDQSFSPVGLKSVHMADGGEEGNGFSPPGNAKRLSSISTGSSKGSRPLCPYILHYNTLYILNTLYTLHTLHTLYTLYTLSQVAARAVDRPLEVQVLKPQQSSLFPTIPTSSRIARK